MSIIILRLFTLQVVNAAFYTALASGQHSFYQELVADRGSIYVQDLKSDQQFVAATNEPRAFIFADPRKIEDPVMTATKLAEALGYRVVEIPKEEEAGDEVDEISSDTISGSLSSRDNSEVMSIDDAVEEARAGALNEAGELIESEDELVVEVEETTDADDQPIDQTEEDEEDNGERFLALVERLSKKDDPYEPVARNIDEDTLDVIMNHELPGIDYVLEDVRSYPEENLGGHIFGFVGVDTEGHEVGQYGLEGYFNDYLAGQNGYLNTETDMAGRWIGVGARHFEPAVDGGSIDLTIDRTIQYIACKKLSEGVERYQADGGSLVIIEPKTGKILAMCNAPDFDPNVYNEVEDVAVYNNDSIFTAYEPGSVFKPLVMAGALDTGAVTPTTSFLDTGEVEVDDYTIQNSDLEAHGWVTMTEVLEESLNTGMIYVMRQMGPSVLKSYVEDFGFGVLSGIKLDTESSGTISSLSETAEVYFATASYGQGITVTLLQLAAAYGALANGGSLMRPYIVDALHQVDDTVEQFEPEVIRQVVSKKTATTIGAMMVSVVENGHSTLAGVPGYYVAGKTGTAQVAKSGGGGYQSNVTMATFAGYGPVDDPAFVMAIMLDHPQTSPWAADTSAAIFGEVADFLFQYLEIAPRREIE